MFAIAMKCQNSTLRKESFFIKIKCESMFTGFEAIQKNCMHSTERPDYFTPSKTKTSAFSYNKTGKRSSRSAVKATTDLYR